MSAHAHHRDPNGDAHTRPHNISTSQDQKHYRPVPSISTRYRPSTLLPPSTSSDDVLRTSSSLLSKTHLETRLQRSRVKKSDQGSINITRWLSQIVEEAPGDAVPPFAKPTRETLAYRRPLPIISPTIALPDPSPLPYQSGFLRSQGFCPSNDSYLSVQSDMPDTPGDWRTMLWSRKPNVQTERSRAEDRRGEPAAEEASLLAESGSIALPGKEEYDPDTTLFGIKGRENDIWKNIKQTMVGPPRSSGSITPTDLETILPSCESSLDEYDLLRNVGLVTRSSSQVSANRVILITLPLTPYTCRTGITEDLGKVAISDPDDTPKALKRLVIPEIHDFAPTTAKYKRRGLQLSARPLRDEDACATRHFSSDPPIKAEYSSAPTTDDDISSVVKSIPSYDRKTVLLPEPQAKTSELPGFEDLVRTNDPNRALTRILKAPAAIPESPDPLGSWSNESFVSNNRAIRVRPTESREYTGDWRAK